MVIIKQAAVGFIVTSPVIKPTSLNSSVNSRNFWLDKALIGVVYITLCLSFNDLAMEYLKYYIQIYNQASYHLPFITYSATTVFPADVWADTNTLWLFSMHKIASFWKGSNRKGYSLAGTELGGLKGM